MIPPIIIATRLVMNKSVLPRPIDQLPNAIQIQITHSGGTSDAAIATHARPAVIFLYPKARNATNQDANAIPRSTRVGCVLLAISLVTSVRGMIQVTTIARATLATILAIKRVRDLTKSL